MNKESREAAIARGVWRARPSDELMNVVNWESARMREDLQKIRDNWGGGTGLRHRLDTPSKYSDRLQFRFRDNDEWKRAAKYYLARAAEYANEELKMGDITGIRISYARLKGSADEATAAGWTNGEIEEIILTYGGEEARNFFEQGAAGGDAGAAGGGGGAQGGGRRKARKTRVARMRSTRRKSATRKHKSRK
jgi:hypothetical protein